MGGPALRLIVLESPGSLTFELQDAPAIAAAGARAGRLTLIDNTWARGPFFKPLAHGVDISVQALTKYVCGHSDVFMGSACASAPGAWSRRWTTGCCTSAGRSPVPTPIRRCAACAPWPCACSATARAAWPWPPGWRGSRRWSRSPPRPARLRPTTGSGQRDYAGACGLFAFVLRPAAETAVNALLDRLQLFGLGFSWGGFESLAISSGDQLVQRRFKTDLAGPLVRLHIGLEDAGRPDRRPQGRTGRLRRGGRPALTGAVRRRPAPTACAHARSPGWSRTARRTAPAWTPSGPRRRTKPRALGSPWATMTRLSAPVTNIIPAQT